MKRFIPWLVLAAVVGLIVLRIAGERAFPVPDANSATGNTGTAVSAAPPSSSTALYQAVTAVLRRDESGSSSFFVPLANARSALAARLALAAQAERTLDVQYYLFHDDEAGNALLAALVDAARNGVEVRLLLDDMDAYGREHLFARLDAEFPSLSVRIFNPTLLRSARLIEYLARFPRVTRRMHNKSFTADGITSIVGGRNIGNEYFDVKTDIAFADLDVVSAGQISQDVRSEFLTYWNSAMAIDVAELGPAAGDDAYQTFLQRIGTALQTFRDTLDSPDSHAVIGRLLAKDLAPYFAEGSVLFDPPLKVATSLFDQSANMARDIIAEMSSANEELLISSPYFIPGESGMDVFRTLRERGVRIVILTNSFAANDVGAVHAGYKDYRQDLLAMGVELYELKPSRASRLRLLGADQVGLHAKAFVVDRKRVFIGSFNLDPRSALHNTEMGVLFNSSEYGEQVWQKMRLYLQQQAYELSLSDGQLLWQDKAVGSGSSANATSGSSDESANESATPDYELTVTYTKDPETSWFQRASAVVIGWLPVEWLL